MVLRTDFSDLKNDYPVIFSMLPKTEPFALTNVAELKILCHQNLLFQNITILVL